MSQFEYQESYRRNLPHIQPPGATMFSTFRLAGSIPAARSQELLQQRELVQRQLEQIKDKQERSKRAVLEEKRFFGKWDKMLDTASTGPFWLRDDKIATVVVKSLHYQDKKRYQLEAFCVMPNHVHLVFTPLAQDETNYYSISTIMHSLKRYTAREANQILKREGDFWQHENYDHYVRDDREFQRIVNYVLNNPVNAGLVSSPEEWKWSYCRTNL